MLLKRWTRKRAVMFGGLAGVSLLVAILIIVQLLPSQAQEPFDMEPPPPGQVRNEEHAIQLARYYGGPEVVTFRGASVVGRMTYGEWAALDGGSRAPDMAAREVWVVKISGTIVNRPLPPLPDGTRIRPQYDHMYVVIDAATGQLHEIASWTPG